MRGPSPTDFQVEPKMPLKGTNVTNRRWALYACQLSSSSAPTQHNKGPCSHGSSVTQYTEGHGYRNLQGEQSLKPGWCVDAAQGVFISQNIQIQSGQPTVPCSCSRRLVHKCSSVCGVATADRLNTVLNLLHSLKHADSIYKFAKCEKKNHGAKTPQSLRFGGL